MDLRKYRIHEKAAQNVGALVMTGIAKLRPAVQNTTSGKQWFFTELYKKGLVYEKKTQP